MEAFRPIAVLVVLFTALACGAATDPLAVSMVHRGDGFNRPENTLESIRYCWSRSAVPESDIWLLKDGVYVAYHDAKRKGRNISDWTWEELRQEDIGSDYGERWKGVRAPTWDEIFAEMKGRPERKIYMDVKGVDGDVVRAMIRRCGLQKQVYCHSGNYALLRGWHAAMPEGLCSLWCHVGNWKHIDFSVPKAVQEGESFMLRDFGLAEKDAFAAVEIVHLIIQCDPGRKWSFCPTEPCLREMVRKAHACGKLITAFPWGTDGKGEEVYLKLREMGFDGWGTDCPESMYSAARKSVTEDGKCK